MANEIQNQFFGAITAIAGNAAKGPSYDKTVIGTIIKIYDDKPSVYRVQQDNISFDAKAQYDHTYALNDQVYITIVQGDYTQSKIIVGKVETKEDEKAKYTDVFSRVVTSGFEEESIKIPDKFEISKTAISVSFPSDDFSSTNSILYEFPQPIERLDYLGVTVAFNSIIENQAGSYALIFTCQQVDENNNLMNEKRSLTLSSLQLYGNPYYAYASLPRKATLSLYDLTVGKEKSDKPWTGRVAITGITLCAKEGLELDETEWKVSCTSLSFIAAQDYKRYPKDAIEIVFDDINNPQAIKLNKWIYYGPNATNPIFITNYDLVTSQAATISYYYKKSNAGEFTLIKTQSLNVEEAWGCDLTKEMLTGINQYQARLNISPFVESNTLSFGKIEVPEVKVGPPNTLRIEPIGKIRAYCIDTDVEKPSYKVIYYNADGQSEELTDVEWTWAGSGTVDGDTYAITSYPFDAGDAILSAAARDLTVSIPIPKTTKDYIKSEIKGTNYISYSSEGTNPTFEAIPYSIDGVLAWGEPSTTELEGFYGKFAIDKESCQLQVPTRINSTNPTLYIKLVGEKILYPVIIERKAFENEILNRWQGNLVIDSEKNYALSNLIGAGIKSDQNGYTGVLMGLLKTTTDTSFSRTGIYGFKDSERVFQLDDSGYFYVGNKNGHLSFDQNGLLLQTQRLVVDVKDNKGNTTFKINSNAAGSDSIVLQAGSKFSVTGKGAMTCTSGKIAGWTISDHTLTNYNGTKTVDDGKTYYSKSFGIQVSNNGLYALAIGNLSPDGWDQGAFKVNHDGVLTATGANISGTLTAGVNSQLGPWLFTHNELQQINVEKFEDDKYTQIIYIYDRGGDTSPYPVYPLKLQEGFRIGTTGVYLGENQSYIIGPSVGTYDNTPAGARKYKPLYERGTFNQVYGFNIGVGDVYEQASGSIVTSEAEIPWRILGEMVAKYKAGTL